MGDCSIFFMWLSDTDSESSLVIFALFFLLSSIVIIVFCLASPY